MTRHMNIQWISKKISDIVGDPSCLRLIRLLLIATLIRVLLMPFFGHVDVLSEARRIFYWAEHNIFFDHIARNTTQLIEELFFMLFRPFLPDANWMFYIEEIAHSTANVLDSFEFVSQLTIFRTLFILKIPFLICDLLTAWAIYNLFDNKDNAITSCKIWLFNPVTIFAFYIFGRFESIPIFFFSVSLLYAKRNHFVLSAISLALCLNGREMMNLYFPIFILSIISLPSDKISSLKKIAAILIILTGAAIAMQIPSLLFHATAATIPGAASIVHESRAKHLFAYQLHGIIFIILVYIMTLLWVWNNKQELYEKVLLGCSLAMFSFFAFSSHTAHFTSWMIIFPAIYAGRNPAMIKPFIAMCIAWTGYWGFLTDKGVFTFWLASPFSLYATTMPNLPTIFTTYNNKIPWLNLIMMINIFKTFFVATLIYMVAIMIRSTIKTDENPF